MQLIESDEEEIFYLSRNTTDKSRISQSPTRLVPGSYPARTKFECIDTNKMRRWSEFVVNKYWNILLLLANLLLSAYSSVFLLSRHESVFRVMQTGIYIPLFLPGRTIFAVSSGDFVQASRLAGL